MKPRAPQVAISLLFGLLASLPVAHAQPVVTVQSSPPTTTTQTPPAAPPDQKAYDEARRIKDPAKIIEALEKVTKDYPERFVAFQARNDVLDSLIKNFPDQKQRIRAAAEKILEPNQGIFISGGSYLTVPSRLVEAGLFLDWAEELIKK